VLLMAVPEFQELAWRFWTDSQATLVCLIYLAGLIAFIRRPALVSGALSVICLGLLLLTKESAAVTFTPFLAIALAIPLSRRMTSSGRRYAAMAAVLIVVLLVGLAVLLARAPTDLARNALLEKTFGAGPLVFISLRQAIPVLPSYSQQLVGLIGPVELSSGFVWGTLVGLIWLAAQAGVAIVADRNHLSAWALGWLVAALAWVPAMEVPWRDLASLHQSDPWIAIAAGGILVVVASVAQQLRGDRRPGWALAMLGMVLVAVLSERLIISVTPKVSAAALTFRSLMPVVPLFAVVAGAGLTSAASALALLVPQVRWARPACALAAAFVLIMMWSPLFHDRLSNRPLLGQVADRGGNRETSDGLLVHVLLDAQPWLEANLQPGDVVLAGKGTPRHLAWYADLGIDGMNNLIDVGSQDRTPEQRRRYVLDRLGPHGVDYVVDYNADWTDPGGDKARQWRQTFDLLSGLPNVETAYVVQDKYGYPVFYVLRNHGYVAAPQHD
jgi:hypothetical protein